VLEMIYNETRLQSIPQSLNQYINHIEEKTEECPKQSLLGLQKSVCATNYAVVYG
jgi:hypothetical protein